MNATTADIQSILAKLEAVTPNGPGYMARCPAHKDGRPSLSINLADDGKILLNCFAGCTTNSICAGMGVKLSDLFPPKGNGSEIIATYPYRDAAGKLLFEVVRMFPKDFRQRKPDATAVDGWNWSTKGVKRVLYRLPEVLQAVASSQAVYVAEGEKDVARLVENGFCATCNAGGAGKWLPEYSECLRGAEVVILPDKDEPGRAHAAKVASAICGIASSVKVIELPDVEGKPVKDAYDFFSAGAGGAELVDLVDATPEWTADETLKKPDLARRLSHRRFNIRTKPIEPPPRYFIKGTPVFTAGNLSTVYAGPKAGKSSFIAAGMASAMTQTPESVDCLGFSSRNDDGLALIHIDTEQSIADHHRLIERSVRRAGLSEPQPWLMSYCATGFNVRELRESIPALLEQAKQDHGGAHSVILDGSADFVADVNDPEECNAFVAELHGLAIAYTCPILNVIHLNPGTEKTRGHLGSQLERKSETNLRLENESGVVVAWAEKNRRAPILKANGPRFVWSDEFRMHVSTETAGNAKADAERGQLRFEAVEVFQRAGKTALPWGEFTTTLQALLKMKSHSGAVKRFDKMRGVQVVQRNLIGNWELAT